MASVDREIDFVVRNCDGFIYSQVALTIRSEKTKERELAAFAIKENHRKILLTLDPEEASINGILQRNALKWFWE